MYQMHIATRRLVDMKQLWQCSRHPAACVAARPRQFRIRCQPPQREVNLQDAPSLVEAAPEIQSASTPSRLPPYHVIAALAATGALETCYLSASKLGLLDSVACPTSGCDSVLNSGYASLLGVPLPLFGFLAYSTMGVLALVGGRRSSQGGGQLGLINQFLAGGSAAMATTSAYLMYILFTKLGGEQCVWCFGSAGLSLALLAAMYGTANNSQRLNWAPSGMLLAAATFSVLYSSWKTVASIPDDFYLPYSKPRVETVSTPQGITLARKLQAAGAKFYGAFWCSHCLDQKEIFGEPAVQELPYVECYPGGWRKGTEIEKACDVAGIKSFPSWVINGQLVEGEQELDQLEALLAGK